MRSGLHDFRAQASARVLLRESRRERLLSRRGDKHSILAEFRRRQIQAGRIAKENGLRALPRGARFE
jgi:hypothetical protein